MSAATAVESARSLPTPDSAVQSLPRRRFGRTEESVPVVGLGTGPGGFGLPDNEAIRLYHTAIDRGITYIDTAPGYARAHAQWGEVLPSRRSEVFLVTKCFTPTAEEALSIHEQSLKDLKVEQVDLLYAHCVGSYEPEQLLAPDGVFAGLLEAKRRGWTRFIGFTSHHKPRVAEAILRAAIAGDLELDAVMLAMNYADRHTYGFENRVLPLAQQLDLGVAVMKVYGGAREMNYEKNRDSALGSRKHWPAFRYALSLPGSSTAVIGMYTEAEIDQNIAWARQWTALTAEDSERLDIEGREVAEEWGAHFGDVE